jgi:hypothetical protein
MGAAKDLGLDLSPRKRNDAERRNTPGFGTGIRLSSSLLLRLQATVSPPTPPSILSATGITGLQLYMTVTLFSIHLYYVVCRQTSRKTIVSFIHICPIYSLLKEEITWTT